MDNSHRYSARFSAALTSAVKRKTLAINVVGLVGAMIGLAGCAMGPDYQRPNVELPPQYHQDLAQDSVENGGQVAWQSFILTPMYAS